MRTKTLALGISLPIFTLASFRVMEAKNPKT